MNRVLRPVGSALLLAASQATPAIADEGASRPCVVQAGRGETRAGPSAPWTPLAAGSPSPSHGEVRAIGEPLRFCLMKSTTVELAPQTTIVLRGDARVVVDAGTRVTALDVALREGEIAVDASPSMWRGPMRKPVMVRGPGDVVAVDWGGGTRARLLPARGSLAAGLRVGSIRGDVLVSGQSALRQIHAGFGVELRPGSFAAPYALASPPGWSNDAGERAPGSVGVVSGDGVARLAARFDPVAGALGYEAEISADPSFSELIARIALRPSDLTFTSPPLRAGRYFARASTRGADGLTGLPGAPRPLRVIKLALPRGGALLDGVVVLPHHRSFTWDDIDGVELGKNAGAFAAAPREIGLDGGEQQITARIRLVGERAHLPLLVMPQSIRAEIDLGPKTATWPLDPVWITVRLTSPSDPRPSYDPVLRVTVNLVAVTVPWQRDGNVLRATLPPQPGAGPWVVRVEARDQGGRELGFGSLEVIGKTAGARASR